MQRNSGKFSSFQVTVGSFRSIQANSDKLKSCSMPDPVTLPAYNFSKWASFLATLYFTKH